MNASLRNQSAALIREAKSKHSDAPIGSRAMVRSAFIASAVAALSSCALHGKFPPVPADQRQLNVQDNYLYKIAPGDNVNIFVWGIPELSQSVPVRPDGMLTTPLIEDMPASGKTPAELARDLEKELALYVRSPIVTVIVNGFVGLPQQQVRVIGEAMSGNAGSSSTSGPKAVPFRKHMTLLDLMIEVGGLTEYAAGNKSVLIRFVDGKPVQYSVRLDDLIRRAKISENISLLPGDILIIPESWF